MFPSILNLIGDINGDPLTEAQDIMVGLLRARITPPGSRLHLAAAGAFGVQPFRPASL